MQKKRRKPPGEMTVLPSEKEEGAVPLAEELWVRPNYNLRQEGRKPGEAGITPASGQRLLELADIALGLKKPAAAKRKSRALPGEVHHQKLVQQKRKRPLQEN